MTKSVKKMLFWSPRLLCILFAAFISMFALDVFEDGFKGLETILALAMHMIPTALIVIIIIVSWRWEWVGGILFNGLAVFYIVWAWGKFPFVTYLAISGPAFLIGILFILNWKYKAELKDR